MASEGIFRRVKLLLDKISAQQMERDAQAALKKGTDPSAAKQNLSQIDSAIDKLKSGAVKLGGILAGAFAVHKIIEFGQESVRQATAAQAGWAQLSNTLKNAGLNADQQLPKIKRLADEFQRSTRFDDDAFVQALDRGVKITGDYAGTLRLMNLAGNVAVSQHIDLADAMEKVAKIQTGQTKGLKEWGIETKNADAGLAELDRRLRGEMATDLTTVEGKTRQLANTWDDLKKSVGEELIGGGAGGIDETRRAIEALTPAVVAIASAVRMLAVAGAQLVGAINAPITKADNWLNKVLDPANRWIMQHLPSGIAGRIDASWQASLDALPDAGGPGLTPAQDAANRNMGASLFPSLFRNKPAVDPEAAAAAARIAALDAQLRSLRSTSRVPGISGGIVGKSGLAGGFADLSGETRAGVDAAQQEIERFAIESERAFHDLNADIEDSMTSAAFGVADAWQRTFDVLFTNFRAIGPAAETLGRGVTASLIGFVGQYASVMVAQELAHAASSVASATGAVALGPIGFIKAALNSKAALQHLAAAGEWGVLAGAAGAASHAVGSGGGSVPSAASSPASALAGQTAKSGPDIHIHLDGVDPKNANHQKAIGEASRQYARRFGGRIVLD